MPRINGKTVWITGASSGIGEALTYALNKKDCQLIISARDKEQLAKVKNNCQNPEKVRILPLDLSNSLNMKSRTEKALAAFGQIDLLINNAGISQRSLIRDTDLSVYDKLMNVNYLGTIALTKTLLPYFIDRKAGHFVTVTSLMGRFGSPYRSGYCGAKHALHGFFDVLRMEHEVDKIKVTLICPGFINTNVAKNALTADGTKQNKNDEATQNGMAVATFALKMIRAIEKERFEAYIGKKEIMGVYLKRFMPRLLHRVVLKSRYR
ncbi:MAG: SDR family oxidoreductase [Flavobacteriaceae bacterium]